MNTEFMQTFDEPAIDEDAMALSVDMVDMIVAEGADPLIKELWDKMSTENSGALLVKWGLSGADNTTILADIRGTADHPAPELGVSTEVGTEYRGVNLIARLVYTDVLPISFLDSGFSLIDNAKLGGGLLAVVTDPVQRSIKMDWHYLQAAPDAYKKLLASKANPDAVKASYRRVVDDKVFYYSAMYAHPWFNVKDWLYDPRSSRIIDSQGVAHALVADPIGLGPCWIKDAEAFARSLTIISGSAIRVLPSSHRIMQLIVYILSKVSLARDGNYYKVAPMASTVPVRTTYSKWPHITTHVMRELPGWLQRTPIPTNLGAAKWLFTYLHLVLDMAFKSDKVLKVVPSEAVFVKDAKAVVASDFQTLLGPWMRYKTASEYLVEFNRGLAPNKSLGNTVTELMQRRVVQNTATQLNDIFSNSDFNGISFVNAGVPDAEIYDFLFKYVKSKAADIATVHQVGYGSGHLATSIGNHFPAAACHKFDATTREGFQHFDNEIGYIKTPFRSLLVDDSYGEGTDFETGGKRKIANLLVSGHANAILRFVLGPKVAFGFKGAKYVLPYGMERLLDRYVTVRAFALGKAHSSEIFLVCIGKVSDTNPAATKAVTIYNTIATKMALCSIANGIRRIAWTNGYVGAFGPAVYSGTSGLQGSFWSELTRWTSYTLCTHMQFIPFDEASGLVAGAAGEVYGIAPPEMADTEVPEEFGESAFSGQIRALTIEEEVEEVEKPAEQRDAKKRKSDSLVSPTAARVKPPPPRRLGMPGSGLVTREEMQIHEDVEEERGD